MTDPESGSVGTNGTWGREEERLAEFIKGHELDVAMIDPNLGVSPGSVLGMNSLHHLPLGWLKPPPKKHHLFWKQNQNGCFFLEK